jgi:hypothetical protein
MGDHQPLEYVVTTPKGDDIMTINFEKVGLIVALARKSFDVLKLLLVPREKCAWSKNLLTSQEILLLAIFIANESGELWQAIGTFSKKLNILGQIYGAPK